MALNNEVIIQFETMMAEDHFAGELCKVCGDPIYGMGYRLVIVSTTAKSALPDFTDSGFINCQSCKTWK